MKARRVIIHGPARLPRRFTAIVLMMAVFGLSGCRSSVSRAVNRPTIAVPPTALPGAPGVATLMDSFDRAVVIGAMTSARGYLTPSLAATSPPMVLPFRLGVPRIPRSAAYTIRAVNARHATVDVTYRLASSAVRDELSIVRRAGRWQIAEIKRA